MSGHAGRSTPRSSLKGRPRTQPSADADAIADERTPLIAGSSQPRQTYSSEETGRGRSQSTQRRSKLNVTIASPTPSIRSVSDVYADEYDADEGEDDGREVEVYVPGKSTSLQTLLNCLGDIIGTGLLAVPIAIAHLGWVLGPTLLVLTGLFTLWTLKIILRIIERDRRMRSFTDIIGYALGKNGERIVTCLFFMEFALWMIALVVLFSDTLAAVWPIYTSDEWKVVCLLITVPTSFVPLRYLSFTSGIGILSTWALVGILVFSGIATPHAPGSLRDPAPTDLWPTHGVSKAMVAFSLILACFGGHGLIPNLIRDMRRPQDADRVVELTYGVSMVVYMVIAVCGYLMYGRNVSDEISKDLAQTPGFSPMLNTIAVWMVALNPLTKVPLGIRPFSDILFSYLHLHPTILIPETAKTPHPTRPPSPSSLASVQLGAHDPNLSSQAESSHNARERLKYWLRPILRMLIAVLATVGALVMPSFESVMAILGGGFGLVMIVILPVWAGGNVLGWKWWYYPVLGVSGVMAVLGVVIPLLGL